MSPQEGFAGSFPRKIAIATRLFGKELQRSKLKWFDLQRADYRLGEKMLAVGVSAEHSQFAQRVNQIDDRLTTLRQHERNSSDTFGGKVKSWWNGMIRTVRIAALERQRRSTLKQLGVAVRKSPGPNASPTSESRAAGQIAEKIASIDASIRELRASTYVWARRPLLTSSLVLLLAMVGLASFKAQKQQSLFVRQNNRPSPLSEDQFKTIQSQTQSFREQMLRQQAELLHQETEAKQGRIAAKSDEQRRDVLRRAEEEVQRQVAAAEQAYRVQQERQRAEVEKKQREEAQERERMAAGERKRQEEKQREEERRIAAEKARQEQQRQREAQEQRAKTEAVARAEQQSKQEVRKVAQAFVQALERNDMHSASSLTGGDEKQLSLAKAQHDFARSFVRMQLARAKKFGGDRVSTFFDPSWSNAEEHIEGDRATVKNGMISYSLEKSGQTWKVNLPESSGSDLLSVVSSLTHEVDEITSKVEKGDYKNDKEAENAFEAKLAAVTTAQTSRSRSDDSLAVERHIRSRLIGGMTERQIVEISDLIAEKFAPPEVSPIRDRCFKGTGDQRQFDWDMVYRISKGEYVPSARSVAKRLDLEIVEMVPPRAVFKMPLREAKALPPIEEPIHQGPRTPGSLVNEHLETFTSAFLRLADAYLSQRPYTGHSRLSYLKQVESLKAGDVLYCRYESGDNFFHERPYFFWYRETPPDLEDLLRTLPKDHPIRQIGPPLEEAPPTLELAMKANVETADDVKKMMAESKVRAEKEARRPKGTSYERGRDLVYKALGVAFLFGTVMEVEAQHGAAAREEELQKIIAASGGAKVRCPECKGSGKLLRTRWNQVSTNPFAVGTQAWKDYEETLPGFPKTKLQSTEYVEKCGRCNGNGWVDK